MTKEDFKRVMLSFLHQPYRWGGDDPMAGFDCSGLVQELLAILNLDPVGDQTADALMKFFLNPALGKIVERDEYETGCLAFYGVDGRITHVAMMFDPWTILEAGGGGSKTLTLQDAINQNAYVRLRPVTRRKDLVCVIRPLDLRLYF